MRADLRISRDESFLNVLFALVVAATILVRITVLLQYSRVLLDSDQPIMWAAAHDYARGIFSEPRFYAQDYNTHMESLFAVPLLWLGMPVYHALPLATHSLFIFPYLFAASYLFFKKRKIQAIVLLSIVLCMPAACDVMNSISRGFVTSLLFASFFVINLIQPRHLGFLALNTTLTVVGYFVSPVSLLATIPFSFYLFLFNYKNPAYYKTIAACLTLAVPLHFLFDQFYLNHPDYIVLGIRRTFSLTSLATHLSHLDLTFAHVGFFADGKSISLLLAWTGLLIFLFFRSRNAFWAFVVFLTLIAASFTMDKSVEGTGWLFGSRSRLYLPVPFVMGMFLSTVSPISHHVKWLFAVPLFFAVFKIMNYEKLLEWHFDQKNFWGVSLMRLDKTLEAINVYKRACEREKCDFLMMSGRFWLANHLAYGGPALHADYPSTELTNEERRYVVREHNKNKVIEKFVFISMRYDFHEKVAGCRDFNIRPIDYYGMYAITGNRMKTRDFIELVNRVEEKDACPCSGP